MIKTIKVTNYLDESLTLDLASPEKSGLVVLSADGLGPVKSDLHMTDLASGDGAVFNSARLQTREITLELALVPVVGDEAIDTVEKIRHMLYKYFPAKKQLKLNITTEERSVYTYGYVEDTPIPIFDRQVKATITILCPDPYFYATKINKTNFIANNGLFEFPFSVEEGNPVSVGETGIEFTKSIEYQGDTETGITITVNFLGPVRHFRITNLDSGGYMEFDDNQVAVLAGESFRLGDKLTISTVRGSKKITLRRDKNYNILGAVNRGCEWFQMNFGNNIFQFSANNESGSTPYNMDVTISIKVAFAGV